MKILISGTGRGGTNLLTELTNRISAVPFTRDVEDRSFFTKDVTGDYGTKLSVDHPTFTLDNVNSKLVQYPDLFILFAVRHPVDTCLSKILRGRKSSDGGDKCLESVSADGTLETSAEAVLNLYRILPILLDNYPTRVTVIKMEDIITDTKRCTNNISSFLGITPKDYSGFQTLNRNTYQKKRYGNKLVNNVDLYLDLKKNFDGCFNNEDISYLKSKLSTVISIYYP